MKTLQIKTGSTPSSLSPLSGENKHVWIEGVEIHSAVNQIPRAVISITLNVNDNATIERCRVGYEVQIINEKIVLFNGIITRQNFQKQGGEQNTLSLVLTCRHALFRLQTRIRSQLFRQQKDHAILSSLFNGVGVTATIQNKDLDVEHEQMIQLNCSDWEFLRTRIKANNVWLFPTTTGVSIQPPRLAATPQHVLLNNTQTVSAEWEFSYPSAPAGIEVSGWDIREQKLNVVSPAGSKTASQLGSLKAGEGSTLPHAQSWKVAYPAPLSPRELSALSKAVSQRQEAISIRTEFVCALSPHYRLGDTIQLPGFATTLKGTAIITEVTHTFIDGEKTTIRTGLEDDDADVPVLAPKIDGLYIGLVHEMAKDPTDCFRLQVTIPSLGITPNQPLWARFSQPYASEDSGICFYPEKNDEVILGFFDNDPRYPVILGSLHNPKKKAPVLYTAANEQRGFVFKQKEQTQSLLFDRKASTLTLQNRRHDAKELQVFTLDASKMTVNLENRKDDTHHQSLHFDAGTEVNALGLQSTARTVTQSLDFRAGEKTMTVALQNNHDKDALQSLTLDALHEKRSIGLRNECDDGVIQSLDLNAGGKVMTVGLQNNHNKVVQQKLLFDAQDQIPSVGLQNKHKDNLQSLDFHAGETMTAGLQNTATELSEQTLKLDAHEMDLTLSNQKAKQEGKQLFNFRIKGGNFTTLLSNASTNPFAQTLTLTATGSSATSVLTNTTAADNKQTLHLDGPNALVTLENTKTSLSNQQGINLKVGSDDTNQLWLADKYFNAHVNDAYHVTLIDKAVTLGNKGSHLGITDENVTIEGTKQVESKVGKENSITLGSDLKLKSSLIDIKGSTSVKIGSKVDLG